MCIVYTLIVVPLHGKKNVLSSVDKMSSFLSSLVNIIKRLTHKAFSAWRESVYTHAHTPVFTAFVSITFSMSWACYHLWRFFHHPVFESHFQPISIMSHSKPISGAIIYSILLSPTNKNALNTISYHVTRRTINAICCWYRNKFVLYITQHDRNEIISPDTGNCYTDSHIGKAIGTSGCTSLANSFQLGHIMLRCRSW